jgi:hypothetical protein
MLLFVQDLFVRLAPNVTAWCSALEASLLQRGFAVEAKVSVLTTMM